MPTPVIPTPQTWPANAKIKVPYLRADVSDAVAFLTGRPLFAARDTLATSIPNSVDTALLMNTVLADTWGGHSTATSPDNRANYYCQVPGWYLCKGTCPFTWTGAQSMFAAGFSATTGGVAGGVMHGALQLDGSGHHPSPQVCDLIEQTVTGPIGGTGDFISATGGQITGAANALSSTATVMPYWSARWVCAVSGTQPLPVPPLAVAPSPITSSWLNANIRDTISFLIYPPICRAVLSTAASLPNQAFPAGTIVPFNATTVDNYAGFTSGAAAHYTAPVAGTYFCYGQFNLAANTATAGYCAGLSVNGGTTQWGDSVEKTSDTTGGGAMVMKRLRLAAGDTVAMLAKQGTGAAVSYLTTALNQCRLVIVWDGT